MGTFRAWSRILSLWYMSKFITLSRNSFSDRIHSQPLPEFHLWHVVCSEPLPRIPYVTHGHIQSLFQNSVLVTFGYVQRLFQNSVYDIWVCSETVTKFHLCDTCICSEPDPQCLLCDKWNSTVWCDCSHDGTFRACSRISLLWHMGTFRGLIQDSICVPHGYAQSTFWDCGGDAWISLWYGMLIGCICMVIYWGFYFLQLSICTLYNIFFILPLQTRFGSVGHIQCLLKHKVTASWITYIMHLQLMTCIFFLCTFKYCILVISVLFMRHWN
jgi:hypothetical protein